MISRTGRLLASLALALGAPVACTPPSLPAGPPPSAFALAPPAAAAIGAPLPPGWVWPVNPGAPAAALADRGVIRPVDAEGLRALQGAPGCEPVEVAPGTWIRSLCAPPPRIALSDFVTERAPAPVRAALPDSVDLRATGLDGPVKDQQQSGVCWSFALSTVMENALRRAGRPEVMSPLHMVADQELDQFGRKGHGRPLVREAMWPYDPAKACAFEGDSSDVGCSRAYHVQAGGWRGSPELVAERGRADQTGLYTILGLQKIPARPLSGAAVAHALASGEAVYVGMKINARVWGAYRRSSEAIPDFRDDGRGGHAVALVGYRTVGGARQYLLHNSWTRDWGNEGYGWITEAMLVANVDDAFTLEVGDAQGRRLFTGPVRLPLPVLPAGLAFPLPFALPGGLPSALPFPLPFPLPALASPPAAASSDCPSGQARDLLLGACAPVCPSGGAPAAGLCLP